MLSQVKAVLVKHTLGQARYKGYNSDQKPHGVGQLGINEFALICEERNCMCELFHPGKRLESNGHITQTIQTLQPTATPLSCRQYLTEWLKWQQKSQGSTARAQSSNVTVTYCHPQTLHMARVTSFSLSKSLLAPSMLWLHWTRNRLRLARHTISLNSVCHMTEQDQFLHGTAKTLHLPGHIRMILRQPSVVSTRFGTSQDPKLCLTCADTTTGPQAGCKPLKLHARMWQLTPMLQNLEWEVSPHGQDVDPRPKPPRQAEWVLEVENKNKEGSSDFATVLRFTLDFQTLWVEVPDNALAASPPPSQFHPAPRRPHSKKQYDPVRDL